MKSRVESKEIKLLKKVSLSDLTTLRLGGIAEEVCFVQNEDQLNIVVENCREQRKKYLIIGSGSNLLFTDAGFKGVIIKLQGDFKKIEVMDKNIIVGAGVKLSELIELCRNSSISSIEHLFGIPGTIGGAISMNAGSKWGSIGDVAVMVKTIGRDWREISENEFKYRKGITDYVTFVQLKCEEKEKEEIENTISQIKKFRKNNQPAEARSAGSVFMNPQGQSAGKLIENAGWRGKKVGNILVSDKHANHIIPLENAKADEYIGVLSKIRNDVFVKFSVLLEPELRIYRSEGTLYEF